MTRLNLAVIITAILMTGAAGLGNDQIPNAEAQSRGVYLASGGSASNVCGLMLCSEYPGGKAAYQANWASQFGYYEASGADRPGAAPVSSHNADKEFPAKLDVFIHKFELGKITVGDALESIGDVYHRYENAGISTNIVKGVGDKLRLYEAGTLSPEEAVESIHLTAEPQNVNPEYQGALDEVIHKFELDKISADEAIDGIMEVHDGFTGLYITSDLIVAVDEIIALIDSGKLAGADAVEAVHLTAEPQNVNPEFIGALDEYLHKFELDRLSAEETIAGVTDVHDGLTSLYISSDLVETVGIQINIYQSGDDSAEHVLEEIHGVIEEAETAAVESADGAMPARELPPNTVDMPVGAGIPGCEEHDACYAPTHLTVSAGTTVTWINSDGLIPHTVTAGWPDSDGVGTDYPGGNGFDSDFMSGGATFEHTFNVPGEYDYYCELHHWMVGSITVE